MRVFKKLSTSLSICIFILVFSLAFSACKGAEDSKDESEQSVAAFTSYETDSGIKVTARENGDNYVYDIEITAEDGGVMSATVEGDRSAFLAKALAVTEDMNFDGLLDLVITTKYASSATELPALSVWLQSSETGEFERANAELCNYELFPELRFISVSQSAFIKINADTKAGTAYTDGIYAFDESGELKALRTAEVGKNEDGDSYLKITDYSDGGSFLMYSRTMTDDELKSTDIPALLFTGLDGKSLTEQSAEDAVYRVAGSKSSGVNVDCEGLTVSEGKLYYIFRADKSDLTSAYYYVDTLSGEVTRIKSGSGLI